MVTRDEMRVLIDTDAFCKLAGGEILEDSVRLIGANLSECGRLPALPHMLRRGRLRKALGPETCDTLAAIAETIPVMIQPNVAWLERLTPLVAVDPGEAQIFSAAVEHGLIVVSGDKRALRVLKDVDGFPSQMVGRIVVLEAILIALCDDLGPDVVRQRLQAVMPRDIVIEVCFSDQGSDPRDGLRSYFESLATELAPLVLWNPWSRRSF